MKYRINVIQTILEKRQFLEIFLMFNLKLYNLQLRKLGDDEVDGPKTIEEDGNGKLVSQKSNWIAVPNPDGVVREVKERKVTSREETEEVKETEDIQHHGDITDEVSL